MMTVKQIAALTGVSVRTLQFYDEIDLLKPTAVTGAGYRLYDDSALKELQQILFFKELDFTLKEIKAMKDDPQFDTGSAFEKQRERIERKRDRLNALLEQLNQLIKGDLCMETKELDLSGYFRVLTELKKTHPDEIVKQFGSLERFDDLVESMKEHKETIAHLAAAQYGSLESYTQAIEENLKKFLSSGPPLTREEALVIVQKSEKVLKRLTADLEKDVASSEIQTTIRELIALSNEGSCGIDMGENYWPCTAENYISNPVYIKATDTKYGAGASDFIGRALKEYLSR